MAVSEETLRQLMDSLRELPPERVGQVRDFIDFLRYREATEPGNAQTVQRQVSSKVDVLNAIALRCASLPLLDERSDDEILGYNELGLPEEQHGD